MIGTRATTAQATRPPRPSVIKTTSRTRVPDSYPFKERSVRSNGYAILMIRGCGPGEILAGPGQHALWKMTGRDVSPSRSPGNRRSPKGTLAPLGSPCIVKMAERIPGSVPWPCRELGAVLGAASADVHFDLHLLTPFRVLLYRQEGSLRANTKGVFSVMGDTARFSCSQDAVRIGVYRVALPR